MPRYSVRTLRSEDFSTLMEIEDVMFGHCSDGVLGPYYVRLCCDFYGDSCFVVESEDRVVGYLLSFINGRKAYCTTLAVLPEYQGSRVLLTLLRAFTKAIFDRVDEVWFTVEEDNKAARALHAMLGAEETTTRQDFYGPGRPRIVSRIDRKGLDRARKRFERLGLIPAERPAATESASSVLA